MLLSQIYHGATDAFAQDPALRELLRSTFPNAEDDTDPFSVNRAAGIAGMGPERASVASAALDPTLGAPDLEARQNNVQNVSKMMPAPVGGPIRPGGVTAGQVTPRADMGVRVLGTQPVTPDYLAQLDQLYGQVGPVGTGEPRVVPGAPPPAARPAAAPAPAPARKYPDASTGNPVSAFLAGLGASDAILPALGGGLQAVENLDRTNKVRNQTVRALINRGLDEDTALAAVNNPELMKTILPRLFGGRMKLGKMTTAQGEQSIFYDEFGNVKPVGAPGSKGGQNAKFKQKMQENDAETIKTYRTAADEARTTLSNLSQLETARKGVGYEGMPLADAWSRFMGVVWNEGAGENVRSLATGIQLGFTNMTKGAITDREMGIFAGATPGLQMSDAGADGVIKGMRAGAKRTIERTKFFEQYAQRTGGDLNGAQAAWNDFIEQNPILSSDPKKPGSMVVNDANVGNWQRYLPRMPSDTLAPAGGATITPASGDVPNPLADTAGPSPADYGEDVEGMTQLPDGRWVVPDPNNPERYLVWEPPS